MGSQRTARLHHARKHLRLAGSRQRDRLAVSRDDNENLGVAVIAYRMDRGEGEEMTEGETTNCVKCYRKKVRADIMGSFACQDPKSPGRRVTFDSYLNVERHVEAIFCSSFWHNTPLRLIDWSL